jgi:deoxyribodipyrimidine photo-lyase
MSSAIWWIRRDLRLSDNQALSAALTHGAVIPVFILDPHLLERTPQRRQTFLFEGLRALDADLRSRGSQLTMRRGNPTQVLATLLVETGADAIYAEEDFTPYARRRDGEVARRLPLHLVNGQTVHPPGSVLKKDLTPYTVFTPYSRAWKALLPARIALLPPPSRLVSPVLPSESLPASTAQPLFPAGEVEAQRRLADFLAQRIFNYAEARNRVDLEGTSVLSPYIRFGMLSLRQAVSGALAAIARAPASGDEESAETWLNELIWREFYIAILWHFPGVLQASFRQDYRNVAWVNDRDNFAAWKEGRTGYPIVDAHMRHLAQTGWMHNRGRMITASFLVKDLLVDWRWGERWFMENLLDGDPAANNGGWQWTAGTGTDAAPYFRVFNPVLQGKKFDPHGNAVRRWLPELASVANEYIHTPWKMPLDLQTRIGCVIGRDYPFPIIEHDFARQRVLDVYGAAARKKA